MHTIICSRQWRSLYYCPMKHVQQAVVWLFLLFSQPESIKMSRGSSANRRNFFDILYFNQRKQMHNPLLWHAQSVSIYTHRLHICMTHCTYLMLVTLGERGFLDRKCWYMRETIHCVYRMSMLVFFRGFGWLHHW